MCQPNHLIDDVALVFDGTETAERPRVAGCTNGAAGVATMAVFANNAWYTPVMNQPHALAAQLGGPQFANAGYYVDLNLPAGTHTIVVYMQSNVSGGVTSVSRVVTVNRPPNVSIPSPTNPYVVSVGANLTLVVSASDPDPGDAVSRVEWYSNNVFIGQSTTAPSFGLPITNAPAGTYVLRARAFDSRGYWTDSTTVTLIVNAPPTVPLSMPSVQSVAYPVFRATTTDDGPSGQAVRVDYYFGSMWLGASTAGNPFQWQYPGVAPPGVLTITALATDDRGLQRWSAPFALTLQ